MKSYSAIALGYATLLFASLPFSANAQPQPNCKSAKTQVEMNVCAQKDAQAADQQLNQTYRRVRAKFKGMSQDNQLVNAQLAWIKFRDSECTFASDRYKGGSIAPLVYSRCVETLTIQRTKSLENYLTEGSL